MKSDKTENKILNDKISDLNLIIKNLSIHQVEVAKLLLPGKAGEFKNQDDLKGSIKKRENVINQGIIISNWI